MAILNMATTNETQDGYASRDCRFNAWQTVLDDNAITDSVSHRAGGMQEQIRRWFAAFNHRGAENYFVVEMPI